MGKLIVLVGLPRSGKSTYCKKYDQLPKTVVINSDNIRLALHSERYNRLAEPFVHAITKVVIRSLYNQGYTVVIDETNTTENSIRQWLEIDPEVVFIYIYTDWQECERRAIACGQNDLVDKGVIRRMHDNLVRLANYRIDQMILKDGLSGIPRLDKPYYIDVVISIENIREEYKKDKKEEK